MSQRESRIIVLVTSNFSVLFNVYERMICGNFLLGLMRHFIVFTFSLNSRLGELNWHRRFSFLFRYQLIIYC